MMLHRHFEKDNSVENMTRLRDVTPKEEFVSEVFPPDAPVSETAGETAGETTEEPKRRGRPKKTE